MIQTFKGYVSSADAFIGRSSIYGEDKTAYMTRLWIGRLRLHIFWRADADRDPHDHPWPFWTFPLTSYVEEVTEKEPRGFKTRSNIVRAFRWHYRPATHTHRVLGRFKELNNHAYGYGNIWIDQRNFRIVPGNIVTLVWRGKLERKWGFLKNRDGEWCWVPWKEYIFGGGRDAPCSGGEDDDRGSVREETTIGAEVRGHVSGSTRRERLRDQDAQGNRRG